MRRAFVESLVNLANRDDRVVLITADLGWSVLEPFIDAFPGRYLNVGIAEQNMIGVATGLALAGYVPFAYSIATFASMRCYEQIRNGPVLHELPVRIVGVGGGYSYGHAGPTHYALEDVALARVQPGMTVLAPADDAHTRTIVSATRDIPGPVYLRLGKTDGRELLGLNGAFRPGAAEIVRAGVDVLIMSYGDVAHSALEAATTLETSGVSAAVAVLGQLPFVAGPELVELVARFRIVLSVEDAYRVGGLASVLSEAIACNGLRSTLIVRAVTDSASCDVGRESYMRARAGLDPASIAQAALDAWGRS